STEMKNDFIIAINQVCSERQLSKEVVLEAVEAALISAYKRNFGSAQTIVARIDPETGKAQVYAEKEVVEEVRDQKSEILLAEAQEIDPNAEVGQTILIESTPRDFGRIAAQTAKQVILQRIREAEREALYTSYADRTGELINGTVQSVDYMSGAVTLNLGKTEAILPRREQIPGERYYPNQRFRAYVVEVNKTNRGPQIIVSRTHRNMLRRLLELEVPEIFNGTVEIKGIAREAGSRSKVAVAALQDGVDPVGACVGMRGVRIQNVVNELSGEKIDVVEWSPEMNIFIANALSPAKVVDVTLEEGSNGKTATVVVPNKQLSLAIGKEGQNARLAAKLTGWRIDIKSVSEMAEEAMRKEQAARIAAERAKEDLLAAAEAILLEKTEAAPLAAKALEALGLSKRVYNCLTEAGITNLEQLLEKLNQGDEEMLAIPGIGSKSLAEVKEKLQAADLALAEAKEEEEPEPVEEESLLVETELVEEALVEEAVVAEAEEVEPAPVLAEEITEEEVEVEVMEPEAAADEAASVPPEESPETIEAEVTAYLEEEEEEEGELIDKPKKKKKKGRSKRTLVYDEEMGEVVVERRRKPSRRVEDWEEY
ncbi:MAG: transcription termination factor NusA, partial [Anaerolineae bacterium]|nr:transcription termination factor NusA [Anaerolineae bacterium]